MGYLRAGGLLILLLWMTPAAAQNQALLVDGSKSMRPYYSTGKIRDLTRSIYDVLKNHGNTQIMNFSTDVTLLHEIEDLNEQSLGDFTYLDRAIDFPIRKQYAIAWMITDNIQSQSSDPEAANTEIFYQKLRSPAVKKVVIFPLLQSPGTSGLVIYAIEFSPDADELFEKAVTEFSSSAKGIYRTEALHMKPLDRNTVDINIIRGTLQPNKSIKVYQEGQNVHETLELRFKSRFEHLKIVDSQIQALQAKSEFPAGSLLKPEKREIAITPERVASLDPQGETEQIYSVTVDLGKVKLKKDLASLWKAAWGGKSGEDVALNLSFVIQVPQQNFKFRDSFVKSYSANTPQAAQETGKIYGIEKLPLLLGETTTPVTTESSLPFRVTYPWWPAILWIILLLAGLALIVGIVLTATKAGRNLFTRSGQWVVTAETEHGVPLECESGGGHVLVQSDEVGAISKNTFIPAREVKVDGGAEGIRIEDNLRLRINHKGRPVVLLFNRATPSKEADAAPSYTPKKR